MQAVLFWLFAKHYSLREGFLPDDPRFRRIIARVSLERGLALGGLLLLAGIALGVAALGSWGSSGFGALRPDATMRLIIPSATMIVLGFQLAYGCFFISVLDIAARR
jgi:hypothetical protein